MNADAARPMDDAQEPAGGNIKTYREGSLYVFEAVHRIYYNTKKPVPIKEIIIALQGLEGVLKSVPEAVALATGIAVVGGEFLIQSIETGSVIEDIVVKLVFGDQAHLDAFITKIRGNKPMHAAFISAVIAGLVVYGVTKAVGDKQPQTSIHATNSVIIQNGAGSIDITPEAFQAAIAEAVKDKRSTAESALKFIAPARADPGSTISFDPDPSGVEPPGAELSASFVKEAPARIELRPNERVEEFAAADLIIRATNLDSKKTGWAGKLGHRDERLPIELDPSVDERDLFGRDKVRVEAALVFKEKGKSRELMPARIYVRKILVIPKQ